MSIEGGARCGYINPDDTTFAYLKDREMSPKGRDFEKAIEYWQGTASDPNASYDDHFKLEGSFIEPMVTWGINPGQSVPVSHPLPTLNSMPEDEKDSFKEALEFMSFKGGQSVKGTPINVAFIGSCTNGRISDLRIAAEIVKGKKIAKGVKSLVVPGSMSVAKQAKEEDSTKFFEKRALNGETPDVPCAWP